MTDRELFLLQPVAWQHAQSLLNAESDMLRNGVGRKKRIEFLQTELQRQLDHAEVIVADALTTLITNLGINDVVLNLDVIRTRFDALGFGGTVRQIRNLNRRMQAPFKGIDQLIFLGGCLLLSEREELSADLEALFKGRVERLLSNQSVVDAAQTYNEIMSRRDLLSVRDRDAKNLAIEVLSSVFASSEIDFSLTSADRRLFIKIYGHVLDTPLVDIITALINNGGMADLRQWFLKSSEESTLAYRHVLASAVQQRIDAMNRPKRNVVIPDITSISLPQPSNKPAPVLSLLSTDQVMEQLAVSRTTLHRLERAGLLNPIHIGRSKRFKQSEIDRYLGRA